MGMHKFCIQEFALFLLILGSVACVQQGIIKITFTQKYVFILVVKTNAEFG